MQGDVGVGRRNHLHPSRSRARRDALRQSSWTGTSHRPCPSTNNVIGMSARADPSRVPCSPRIRHTAAAARHCCTGEHSQPAAVAVDRHRPDLAPGLEPDKCERAAAARRTQPSSAILTGTPSARRRSATNAASKPAPSTPAGASTNTAVGRTDPPATASATATESPCRVTTATSRPRDASRRRNRRDLDDGRQPVTEILPAALAVRSSRTTGRPRVCARRCATTSIRDDHHAGQTSTIAVDANPRPSHPSRHPTHRVTETARSSSNAISSSMQSSAAETHSGRASLAPRIVPGPPPTNDCHGGSVQATWTS